MKKLRLPFTYFGGKAAISDVIWKHLGDPKCYIEPFLGSGAVLLNRPSFKGNRTEIVNDNWGLLVNFWRAMKYEPQEVYDGMEFPAAHDELMARAYFCFTEGKTRIASILGDPGGYDILTAKYWGYIMRHGAARVITSENGAWKWEEGAWTPSGSDIGTDKIAILHAYMEGGRVVNPPYPQYDEIHKRLKDVIIYNRDAVDVLAGMEGVMTRGTTGIFLDPPYRDLDHTWDGGVYHDNATAEVIPRMLDWVLKNEQNPNVRIVIAGFKGDYPELAHWNHVMWDKHPGMSKHGKNSQECLLLSPCAVDDSLFF